MNIKGFESLDKALVKIPSVRLSVEGRQKTGKTTFALTAPRPLAYIDFDFGLNGVANQYVGEDIGVMQIDVGPLSELEQADAEKIWNDFLVGYAHALKQARSIVIDSGTAAWELLRMARFGKLQQVQPHHYSIVNGEMDGLINRASTTHVNLIITHSVKEEWANNHPTGNLVIDGYKRLGYRVDSVLSTYRAVDDDGVRFGMMVRDCRQNAMMINQHIPQELLNFDSVVQMIYPGFKKGDWHREK